MSPLLRKRLSDEELSRRLASGEAAAFDELYRRYSHRLAAYGAQLLGDGAAGEDVAQVALLNAYQALRRGGTPGNVRGWLYRIAHNAALAMLARRRDLLGATGLEEPVDEPQERSTARGILVGALAALPERQRHVYLLREIRGLRVAEIADELGLASAQVEQALFAARNRLAEALTFGRRLDCEAVRRLTTGPLDGSERRGIRSHLRSCARCRAAMPAASSRLALLPFLPLDWLRQHAGAAFGGGGAAAPAVKVGAAVATAVVVAVPVATTTVDVARRHSAPPSSGPTRRPAARRPPARQEVTLVAARETTRAGTASPTPTVTVGKRVAAVERSRPEVRAAAPVEAKSSDEQPPGPEEQPPPRVDSSTSSDGSNDSGSGEPTPSGDSLGSSSGEGSGSPSSASDRSGSDAPSDSSGSSSDGGNPSGSD